MFNIPGLTRAQAKYDGMESDSKEATTWRGELIEEEEDELEDDQD